MKATSVSTAFKWRSQLLRLFLCMLERERLQLNWFLYPSLATVTNLVSAVDSNCRDEVDGARDLASVEHMVHQSTTTVTSYIPARPIDEILFLSLKVCRWLPKLATDASFCAMCYIYKKINAIWVKLYYSNLVVQQHVIVLKWYIVYNVPPDGAKS